MEFLISSPSYQYFYPGVLCAPFVPLDGEMVISMRWLTSGACNAENIAV
jgi:hypothetical protein